MYLDSENISCRNVGIAQINLLAGGLKENSIKISKAIKNAEKNNLGLVIFPENSLIGILSDEVFSRYPFIIDECFKWMRELSKLTSNTSVLLSFIDKNLQQSVALLSNGKINKIISSDEVCNINNHKYGILLSEINNDSVAKLKKHGAEVIIYCKSTISRTGKKETLQNNLSKIAGYNEIPLLYVNTVGATDNFSYDGASMGIDANGEIFVLAKSFEEDFIMFNPFVNNEILNLKSSYKNIQEQFSLDYEFDMERTYKTIVQGIKDYFSKCNLKRAVLGLSGGLDSTVCAVLLADALGKENVFGISMPSKLTSSESKSDAKELAINLGINFEEISIKQVVEITTECLNPFFEKIACEWTDRYKKSYTPDNIQARARATYLWCISNEFPSCIPIATSDKSEAYMGYATINGDMSGGFAPIADVTKTKLFALARWLNKNRTKKNVIPESIILKKPGAELAINPTTGKTLNAEDALMPYEFLDEIIWRIENKHEKYDDLINSKFVYEAKINITKEQKLEWIDKFFNRMSKAHYKWLILPPSIIVDSNSINSAVYRQVATSGRINYKGNSIDEISFVLNAN